MTIKRILGIKLWALLELFLFLPALPSPNDAYMLPKVVYCQNSHDLSQVTFTLINARVRERQPKISAQRGLLSVVST